MLEATREFLGRLKPMDIKTDPDAYMAAYCESVEELMGHIDELSRYSEAEPYDDSIGEHVAAFFENQGPAIAQIWLTLRCHADSTALIGILAEEVVPHYGSFDAIPSQYRDRLTQALRS